jgi:hypothetical protein
VVDSTTTYTKSSASATLSDVTVGSVISAQGTVDANLTSLDASSVEIGLTGGPGNGPGLAGPGFGPGAGQGPGPMRQ